MFRDTKMANTKFIKPGKNDIEYEEDVLNSRINDLYKSIQDCLDKRYLIPVLTLIYSGIDVMGSLGRPANKDRSTRQDFKNWCETYLIPHCQDIYCNSTDLYAARCSIIHSYSYDSELTDKKKAKPLLYAWGNRTAKELKEISNQTSHKGKMSYAHINDLANVFNIGIGIFLGAVKKNENFKKIVEERAKKYYGILKY